MCCNFKKRSHIIVSHMNLNNLQHNVIYYKFICDTPIDLKKK